MAGLAAADRGCIRSSGKVEIDSAGHLTEICAEGTGSVEWDLAMLPRES